MKYRDKFFGYPLTVVCPNEVDNSDPGKRMIHLKGFFKDKLTENTIYRLYRRYLDFNLDKVLMVLSEIDERTDRSVFMVSIFFPSKWFIL
jgi:hypothetical protein